MRAGTALRAGSGSDVLPDGNSDANSLGTMWRTSEADCLVLGSIGTGRLASVPEKERRVSNPKTLIQEEAQPESSLALAIGMATAAVTQKGPHGRPMSPHDIAEDERLPQPHAREVRRQPRLQRRIW